MSENDETQASGGSMLAVQAWIGDLLARLGEPRRALRRALLHRRPDDRDLLPADLSGALAEARERPLLPDRGRCRSRRAAALPPLPARGRAGDAPSGSGGSAVAARALRLISDGFLDRRDVGALARELCVGERQLRRLFEAHLGAPPLAVARTRRLQLARLLIDQTGLPMTEVAAAAGFGSLRRFNAAVRGAFGRPPSELRRSLRRRDAGGLVLRLPYRPPLAWEPLLDFLGRAGDPGRRGGARRRLPPHRPVGRRRRSRRARARRPRRRGPAASEAPVARRPGRPRGAGPARLRPRRRPGSRSPRRSRLTAVLGSLVAAPARPPRPRDVRPVRARRAGRARPAGLRSRRRPRSPAGSCSASASRSPTPDGGLTHLFPLAAALAGADLEAIGLPARAAETIRRLARAVAEEGLELGPTSAPDELRARLAAIRGIGPWTVEYVAMRALRDPDAFPGSDLGLRYAVAQNGRPAPAAEVEARAAAWRPWRAYGAVYLWASLAEREEAAA